MSALLLRNRVRFTLLLGHLAVRTILELLASSARGVNPRSSSSSCVGLFVTTTTAFRAWSLLLPKPKIVSELAPIPRLTVVLVLVPGQSGPKGIRSVRATATWVPGGGPGGGWAPGGGPARQVITVPPTAVRGRHGFN